MDCFPNFCNINQSLCDNMATYANFDCLFLFADVPPARHLYSQSSGRPHRGEGKKWANILSLLLDAAALEWAGYLKWPDCPLFMTSCPTAQIVFATFSHLKGQRRKDFGITYRLFLSKFSKEFSHLMYVTPDLMCVLYEG